MARTKTNFKRAGVWGSRAWAIRVALGFMVAISALHFSLRFVRERVVFDMDHYWPVSLVVPKLPALIDGVTVGAIVLLGYGLIELMMRAKEKIGWLIGLGFLLVVATNLLQGWEGGFVQPVAGDNSYWADGLRVNDGWALIKSYTTLQPYLNLHSSSHPPGPVLFSAAVYLMSGQPWMWSLLVGGIGVMTAGLLYGYLKNRVGNKMAYYVAGLWLLLPSSQIYLIAGIDAVIGFLFFGVFLAWRSDYGYRLWLTALLLFIASWFTFAVVFLVPILLFDEWRKTGSIKESGWVLGLTAGLWVIIYSASGYNYARSFMLAKDVYAVGGLKLLVNPLSYGVTRLENVLEILVFLTPWLSWIIWQEAKYWRPWLVRQWKREEVTGFMAIASLLGFFILGGYATGETARNAGYIYPFLLLIVANYLVRVKASERQLRSVAWLVLGQSVLMQVFGFYFW